MAVDAIYDAVWNTRPKTWTSSLLGMARTPRKGRLAPSFASSDIKSSPSFAVLVLPQGLQIPGCQLELKYSLVAEAVASSDGYLLRSGSVDEESFGLTLDESLREFLTSLCDRYRSLARRKRLSSPDQVVLGRLRSLLEP